MSKKNILLQLNVWALHQITLIGQIASDERMGAYLVGGPVRDLLLGKPNIDVDVAIEGNGIHIAQLYAMKESGQLKRYPAFKTATVSFMDGSRVDFATTRKEMYSKPGAMPLVSIAPIEDDLYRRDFTINAMAISIIPEDGGCMLDPTGGLKDLKNKRLRVLHDQSFLDDPTRILRALRFSCRFGFDIDQHSANLMRQAIAAGALKTVSKARLLKEMQKIKDEKNFKKIQRAMEIWQIEGVGNGKD